MCGITGFVGDGGARDIERMTESLRHRGPDDGNIFMGDRVALGHRRLSIIDLKDGAQPMCDPESGLVLVYNGEIYNHMELRRELEKTGRQFRSDHSDTETLLKAFAQWGWQCFPRFNGMFACAIYDPGHKKIWLARDRFGEKPLFYCHNEKGFAFASEICALKLWPGFDTSFNPDNVQRFFAWNYLSGNRCVHKDCHALPPGSWLCLDLDSMRAEISTWWRFELKPDPGVTDAMEPELVEELRRLLIQSVRRRLLSDVPLGVFLSGGIDSSAVLAAAIRVNGPESLNTFTIGFHEKSFDESTKAAAVASALQVPNSVEYLSEKDMRQSIPHILARMSEPFGDASLIPTFHLSRFARQHVKVALSGDGGDELFGGYDPLAAISPAQIYSRLVPGWLHRVARAALAWVPASDKNMSLDFKIRRALRGLSWPAAIRVPIWMSGLDPDEVYNFFEKPLTADELFADAARLHARHPDLDELAQAMLFFTRLYLPDDILVKSDRASMMVSLEARAIFLDNDLVDFCASLPIRFKYRKGHRKYLLKKALEGWLPDNILRQPKKGFGIPLNLWLRSLAAPRGEIPGLKAGVLKYCRELHQRRRGDFRFFLWDAQAFSRMGGVAA